MKYTWPFELLKKRRTIAPVIITACIIVLLLLLAGYMFVNSAYFAVVSIRVEGNKYLTNEEVCRIAGIGTSGNILRLNTGEVRNRLLQDLRIADVQVVRQLPGTVVISLKERVPVAYIPGSYGFFEVDRQGVILAVYKNLQTVKLPIITGCKPGNGYVGDTVDAPGLSGALVYLSLLDEQSLAMFSELDIKNPAQLTVFTVQSVQIRLGGLERLEEKAKLTRNMLRELKEKKLSAEYIDLTYATPLIKFK